LQVSELKFKTPNALNKDVILTLMDETRGNRQDDICKGAAGTESISSIIASYPRLKDYSGELVRDKNTCTFVMTLQCAGPL
jgi:hypothetical protein